jgi:large subunit ribosomal protein L21
MKFAVIKTGGKQYNVSEGDVITVERLENPINEVVAFSDVLLLADGDSMTLGKPLISGMTVTGMVMEHPKGEKIRVSQYKAKARYRRVNGHRQSLTTVRIEAIGTTDKKAAPAKTVAAPVEEDTVSTKTPPIKKPARERKTEEAK